MSPEELKIIEGNKLIACSELCPYPFSAGRDPALQSPRFYSQILKYHRSYDWLWDIWAGFRDLRFKEVSQQMYHASACQSISHAICYETIDKAWSLIVASIKWYNNQKL
jgi:hypothetical protein